MAVKTFSVGEVLTASDTNTYLANSGLVYVTSQTIGTAVPQVTVNNCFSSTYDDYRIVIRTSASTANASLRLLMGTTGTGYYSNGYYTNYASATLNGNNNNNAVGYWEISYTEPGNAYNTYAVEVFAPNLAQVTRAASTWATTSYTGVMNGVLNNSTQYTGFEINAKAAGAGTLTGGVVVVYGYRKA